MSDSDHGTPFSEHSTDPIDAWSRSVFEACRDWPLAAAGRWFRSDEGWIRLRIEAVEGEPLEPLFVIELDTSDDRITLDFGSWGTPVSRPDGTPGPAAELAVAEARDLIEDWLHGQVKLATYSDETGWRGSKIIDGGELPAAIEPVPVAIGDFGRVIVKTWRRSDWRAWRRIDDGLWIECEATAG